MFTTQTFDEIRTGVEVRSRQMYPDRVVRLRDLRMTPEGHLWMPEGEHLAFTPWSRHQLASLLGIRWLRWFDDALVSPAERAEEVNRRLHRMDGERKIRAARSPEGPDGIVRGFLGAAYTPIDDARIFDRLARVLGPRQATVRFARAEVTDRGSYYVAVTSDDVDLGNGVSDPHRMGWHLTNSEVGAAALRILEYVLRLVCTNGLVMRVAQKLFYRVHRATSDESIDRDLAYAMTLLPERWETTTRALRAARHDSIAEPEEVLRSVVAAHLDARPHTEIVLAAYREEPEPTRFGLLQAVTRAAQSVSAEDRLALETVAGEIVSALLPVAA